MSAGETDLHTRAAAAAPRKSGVSVVIPFYNRSMFAERLFRSVIAQTLPPAAVFIVDNGSSPQELAACRATAEALDWRGIPYQFLSTVQSGNANVARNLGMNTALTRHVAFVDSDDWWDPPHLDRSLDRLEATGRAGVYAGAVIHRKGVHVNRSLDVNRCSSPFHLLFSENIAQTSSYVLDMEALGATVAWDERLKRHQDFDFFLSVHFKSDGWAFVSTPSTHIDWEERGIRPALDFRSMIRFKKKWEQRIPADLLAQYALSQFLKCREVGAHPMYERYYMRLHLSASGGALPSRLNSLAGYRALKGLVHRIHTGAAP